MHPNLSATPPNFRCARRTNDGENWARALGVSTFTSLWIAVLGMKALDGDKGQIAVGVLGLFLFVPLTFFCWKEIVFPDEYELVIENHTIRWGRSDRRKEQTSIRLAVVKQWVVYRPDPVLYADTDCLLPKRVGLGILEDERRLDALIDFLRQHYPDIGVTLPGVEPASNS